MVDPKLVRINAAAESLGGIWKGQTEKLGKPDQQRVLPQRRHR